MTDEEATRIDGRWRTVGHPHPDVPIPGAAISDSEAEALVAALEVAP